MVFDIICLAKETHFACDLDNLKQLEDNFSKKNIVRKFGKQL
jgi:hypothetical protein